MQKQLIALAIAGLASSAAIAQSNVTIYGVFDGTLEDVKADGSGTSATDRPSMTRAASNSSYIGFKGVEDLGGGNKAVFQVENQFDVQAAGGGTTGLANRDTFVGLTGGWGTVVTGNLTDPYRLFGAKVDYNPGATSIGFTGSLYGEINGTKSLSDGRKANAWAYITPDLSGFSAVLGYVSGEAAANGSPSTNPHAWELAAMYSWKSLFVGYSHVDGPDLGNFTATLAGGTKQQWDRVAATYDFPTGTSVAVLWDQQKAESLPGDVKRKAWGLNVKQNFGPNNVWLEYAKAKNLEGSAATCTSDCGAKQLTLGYSYDLSKRTMIHAYYSKISNDPNAMYDFYVNPVGGFAKGADPQGYGVGIRHTF